MGAGHEPALPADFTSRALRSCQRRVHLMEKEFPGDSPSASAVWLQLRNRFVFEQNGLRRAASVCRPSSPLRLAEAPRFPRGSRSSLSRFTQQTFVPLWHLAVVFPQPAATSGVSNHCQTWTVAGRGQGKGRSVCSRRLLLLFPARVIVASSSLALW